MKKSSAPSPAPTSPWHVFYHGALFETDPSKLPQRIADAERAILIRVKELFLITSDHIEEDQILDDELYALSALRNCAWPESKPVSLSNAAPENPQLGVA